MKSALCLFLTPYNNKLKNKQHPTRYAALGGEVREFLKCSSHLNPTAHTARERNSRRRRRDFIQINLASARH
jgi:hypothetical protein